MRAAAVGGTIYRTPGSSDIDTLDCLLSPFSTDGLGGQAHTLNFFSRASHRIGRAAYLLTTWGMADDGPPGHSPT